MPTPDLLKPALYKASGTPALRDHPALIGGRCVCGHVFFPMQHYGCERCGRHGENLSTIELTGRGRLIASAEVHMHMGKGRQAPFVVGSIALEDGPMVRTLLVGGDSGNSPQPGDSMVTILVPVADGDEGERLDLRFTPQS
jgi:uncharacterized OB-fold protein